MFSAPQPKHERRWPRGQRFGLSSQGVDAEAAYRATVMDVRSLGRDALALAEKRWAEPLGLSPGDGVVMAQIRPGRRSFADLGHALEDCGMLPAQITPGPYGFGGEPDQEIESCLVRRFPDGFDSAGKAVGRLHALDVGSLHRVGSGRGGGRLYGEGQERVAPLQR